MYPLGFLPFFLALLPDTLAVTASVIVPILVLALWLYAVVSRSSARADDAPVHLPGSSLSHILPFFRRRFDFINEGFQLAGQAIYQFSLLRTPVIVLSGEAARRDFFQAKDLDLNAGFKFLSGAIPMVPGVTSNLETRRIALIHKRLVASQTSERLERYDFTIDSELFPVAGPDVCYGISPITASSQASQYVWPEHVQAATHEMEILEDSRRVINTWGYSGTVDPFEQLPELIFQTTVRCLAFTELADDAAMVQRLKQLYDTLDTATTPATVLLPWLPGPSAVRRLIATKRIYDIISKTLDERVKNGVARDDTPQMLIDAGDERLIIIGFIIGLLVAGARSTGTTASWLITFLSGHPQWREKAAEEVRRLVAEHATHLHSPSEPRDTSTEPTTSQEAREAPLSAHRPPPLSELNTSLGNVPLSAWENDTPVLDSLIRETLRVAEPHVAMRQYLPPSHLDEKGTGPASLYLGGKAVPPGAFVMYPFSDVHLSSEVYQDPWRWDPGRPEHNLKAPYAYVGMGAGSTTCLGKRLATLELKLITALFVLGFSEFHAEDRMGAPLEELPRPNWNDILTCKPPAGSCFVRFERTVERDRGADAAA